MFDRSAVVQQHQKLDLRRAQIHFRGLHVGFILDALQLQPVEIDLRNITGFVPVAADSEHLVPESQVLAGQPQHRLGLQRFDKCAPQD